MKKTVKSLLVIFFLAALASITLLSASAASGKLVHGDVSGDGKVDIQDVLMLRKYLADYNYHTGNSSVKVSTATDVTGDAKVNIHDLLMLRQYIANYNYDTGTSSIQFKHAAVIDPAVAPTCTETGLTEGKHCASCNEVFIAQTVLDKLEHTEIANDVAATCTNWGAKGGIACAHCNLSIKQPEFLSPTGHNYVDNKCTLCGGSEIDYSDISLYTSYDAYDFFESAENGSAMKAFYEETEKALIEFHTGTSDAPYYNYSDYLGDLYTVGIFDFAQHGLSLDEARTVFGLLRKDHPAFYWMSYALYIRGNEKIIITTVEEYAKGADRSNYNQILYEGIEEYAKLAEGETDKYSIALAYYDAILKNNKYAYDENHKPVTALWAHSIMGDFRYGEFVCEGYAKLFQLLLNFSGVENMYVFGTANGNHVWNLVRLDDGNWYWFDLTWGDGKVDTYRYFAVLDSFLLSTHTISPLNQLGVRFNPTLPQRANSPFEHEDILEIGETFTVGSSVYVLSSAKTVKLKSGIDTAADKLVYCGVVYDVVK